MKGKKYYSNTAQQIVAEIFFELRERKDLFNDTLCDEATQHEIREACLCIVQDKLDGLTDAIHDDYQSREG